MDRDGLLREIFDSAGNIDQGRAWLDTVGLESNGRSTYHLGLSDAMDDALRSLEVVLDSLSYIEAEKTYPTGGKFRFRGMPRDAFHTACIAHRTRIGNIKRSPGINMAEKALLSQRSTNMKTAQSVYLDKQKSALEL